MAENTSANEEYTKANSDHAWDEPEIKRHLNVLRRRIWVLVTCFVVIVSLGVVHAFRLTPIYRAEARILIEKRSPRVMEFDDVVQLQASDQQYFRTQQELLKSRAVLEKALEQPGVRELFETKGTDGGRPSLMGEVRRTVSAVLGNPPVAPPEPWETLRAMVDAEFLLDTHLLLVIAESPDPERAALIANAVAKAFEQYHTGRKLETSHDVFRFLGQQQIIQSEVLRTAEDTLQRFREEAQEVSLDVQDKGNPVLVKLGRLDAELTRVQLARVEDAARFEVVREALNRMETSDRLDGEPLFSLPALETLPAVGNLRRELAAAEQEPEMLSMIYGPDHPQVRAALARVGLLRRRFADELAHASRSLSAQLEVLNRQAGELQEQYASQNVRALEMARHSLSFNRLQSEVHRQRKLLDILMERMREVDLTADYAKTNVELVETAEIPKVAARPRKGRMASVAVMLGLLVGVGLAFLLEYLDDTIKTPEDLETRIGVPVLGFVPSIDMKGGDGQAVSARGSFTLAEPTSSVTEAYRNIRTNLFFSAPPDDMRVLVVTSAGPQDGKTTTCGNLAVVISQSAKRVLLIDGDFRRSMVHKIFGLKSDVGLSNVLVGQATIEAALQNPKYNGNVIENLDVLVAGPRPPNPAELLGSENMRKILKEAKEKYDRVIVDTPPGLSVADGNILAGMSDGVIMVVKASKNTGALTRRARAGLDGVKARIVGGILNDVRVSRLGYYYSDYYYGYSKYYRSYYSKTDDAKEPAEQGQGQKT